jgi:hypothetical protein
MSTKAKRDPPAPKGFWKLVEAAMVKIYRSDLVPLQRYKRSVRGMDRETRAFVYHFDPLSIAANLSGRTISDQDADAYRRLPEWRTYAGLDQRGAMEMVLTKREVHLPESKRHLTQAELVKEVAGATKLNASEVRKVIDVAFTALRRLGDPDTASGPARGIRAARRHQAG